ncbi:histidinol-phosphate transaminase [Crocinitomix algicola]|uniref:histidinol-phosphate transaminase n=1 Tax=Crocinitomix algicola TaxID=1740263 RepID=UPI000831ACFF|nr:histidinol-phosphate transaminase [Crocinitomix algicola]
MKIEDLIRPNIKLMKAYTNAREEFNGKADLYLDANESPFGQFNRYPDPNQNILKKRLAKYKQVSENQVFIGNGSDEIIDLIIRLVAEPGLDKIMLFPPTYGMYEVTASLNNVSSIKIPLNCDFEIDYQKVEPLLQNPALKVIFICSPNNPSGNNIPKETILKLLNNFRGLIVIDEAYIDFSSENSCLEFLRNFDRLIILQTLSKAWGMASLRIGVAYSNPKLINYLNKIKPPYNISNVNQNLALEGLNRADQIEQNIATIIQERKYLTLALSAVKIVKKVYPSASNFLLIEVDNADLRYQQLLELGIILRNRNTQISNCLRVSIGTPKENQTLIHTLKELQ